MDTRKMDKYIVVLENTDTNEKIKTSFNDVDVALNEFDVLSEQSRDKAINIGLYGQYKNKWYVLNYLKEGQLNKLKVPRD